ncbi:MAG: hypothetical protein JOS17DRAFT_749411 [Linnemannia elongata]|nr:MAG: hypothetical protein JOS17DRAFT_749411 [Linnemannia elongata]
MNFSGAPVVRLLCVKLPAMALSFTVDLVRVSWRMYCICRSPEDELNLQTSEALARGIRRVGMNSCRVVMSTVLSFESFGVAMAAFSLGVSWWRVVSIVSCPCRSPFHSMF